MLVHPDILWMVANERHRELIAEAEKGRLLTSARRARRARKAVRGQPTGNLASCERPVAVPAR